MADYNRKITFTGRNSLVSAIESFLTTTFGSGPGWEVESTYSTTGTSFMRSTNGSTITYVHLTTDAVDTDMVFCDWVDDVPLTNGWVAGTGPASASLRSDRTAKGSGWYAPDATPGVVQMIANEHRFVIQVHVAGVSTTVYGGVYTPHTAGTDSYPNIVVSNSKAILSVGSQAVLDHPELERPLTIFPTTAFKRIGAVPTTLESGAQLSVIPSVSVVIPQDDQASPRQIFAYELYVVANLNGAAESLYLTGVHRISDKQSPGDTVVIGANSYYVFAGHPKQIDGMPVYLAGPMGTAI